MTLHFLGGVPSERVPELRRGLSVPFSPFTLSLGIPAVWPNGIAVLEPHSEPPALLQLHADLSAALLALGMQPEARKFRPHVTFARRANGAVVPPASALLTWPIDSYALVESKPGNGGGYTVLQEYR